jgi:tetratricopeptide (TPR) repeat protein
MVNHLSIIHLSDLHLRQASDSAQQAITTSLQEDVRKNISDLKLQNIYIAITGDLTFSGKSEEFDLVNKFCDELVSGLDREFKRFIFCPGNHDLDWNQKLLDNKSHMDDLVHETKDSVRRVEEKFSQEVDRETLRKAMQNYYNFLKSRNQEYNSFLYQVHSVLIGHVIVNFIALNSAYLFSEDVKYFGYLGLCQIDGATAEARTHVARGLSQFNIMLFHHPFEALCPAKQQETIRLIRDRSNIILNGHVHDHRVYSEFTQSGQRMYQPLVSCARCIYDETGDTGTVQGYTIFDLSFDETELRNMKIYEAKYDRDSMNWQRDTNNWPMTLDMPVGYKVNRRGRAAVRDQSETSKLSREYYRLAGEHFENGKLREAIRCYTRAIELDSKFSDAYFNRGLSHLESGELAEAMSDLLVLEKLQPHSPDVAYLLGKTEERKDKTDEAEKWYREALSRKSDYKQAREALEDLNKTEAAKLIDSAAEAEAKGNTHQALDLVDKAIHVCPTDVNGYLRKSVILAGLGDLKAAIDTCLAGKKIAPDSSSLCNNLGYYYARVGEFDKALEQIDMAIQLDPLAADLIITHLEIYALFDNVKMAKQIFSTAWNTLPRIHDELCETLEKEIAEPEARVTNVERGVLRELRSSYCKPRSESTINLPSTAESP